MRGRRMTEFVGRWIAIGRRPAYEERRSVGWNGLNDRLCARENDMRMSRAVRPVKVSTYILGSPVENLCEEDCLMRLFVRSLLAVVFFAAIALAFVLLMGPRQTETLATLTAVLAVIAAVISAWPSLRVLEMQEDATRPCPTPYFDITSRYGLLLLRVKNLGAGVAYNVRLTWEDPKTRR